MSAMCPGSSILKMLQKIESFFFLLSASFLLLSSFLCIDWHLKLSFSIVDLPSVCVSYNQNLLMTIEVLGYLEEKRCHQTL